MEPSIVEAIAQIAAGGENETLLTNRLAKYRTGSVALGL